MKYPEKSSFTPAGKLCSERNEIRVYKSVELMKTVVKGDQISLPSKKLLAICFTHASKNRKEKLSLLGREAVRSVMVQKEE